MSEKKDLVVTEVLVALSDSSGSNEKPSKAVKDIAHDELLIQQGYKPELERNFSLLSLLGVAFGLTNSWLGIAGSMGEAFSSGGPFMVVYGIITLTVFVIPVGLSLSELVSMYPNSGGQYFWTTQLAPAKHARFWLFLTGTFGWLGSVFTCSSISLTTLQTLIACWQLTHPTFVIHPWHVVVCSAVITCFVSIFNCWQRPLPAVVTFSFVMSLLTFCIIITALLLVSHGHYQTLEFVFVDLFDIDQDMIGITFLVMLTLPTWALAGLDAATHMAEELPQPAKTIPKLIMATILIGSVTLFAFAVSMFFCIKDVYLVMAAPVPLLAAIYQLLDYNKLGLVVLQSLLIVTLLLCNVSANTWQLRNCWSFSRDNGIVGSRWWKQVNKRTKVPVNAHLFSNFLCMLINLVYIGSSTAYNSIITLSVEILYFSYLIPIVCLLIKGRRNVKPGPFWLGVKTGFVFNCLSCFWFVFCLIFFSLPYELPATAGNMNYVCVVYLVCACYVIGYWFIRGNLLFKK